MKTKKLLITVLTAVLVTAFIIGCITPLDDTNSSTSKKSKDGKTLVRLSLGNANSNARTAVPNTSGYSDPEDFGWFELNVSYGASSGNTGSVTLDSPYDDVFPIGDVYDGTNWAFEVELEDDYYNFELIAYLDDSGDHAEYPVAWGHQADVQIDSTHDSVNIVLHEIFVDGVDGSTTYKGFLNPTIDDPGQFIGAELNPYGSSTDLFSDATDGTGVKPGKYVLVAEYGDDGYETAYVREVVYIYSGFTTDVTITAPVLRRNTWQITFDYGDDSGNAGPSDSGATLIAHGANIINTVKSIFNDIYGGAIEEPQVSSGTDVFDGWKYTNSSGAKVGSGDKLIKDITLYATWKAAGAPTVVDLGSGLILSWQVVSGITVVQNTGSYGDGSTTNQPTLDFTLGVSGGSTYTWYDDRGNILGSSSSITKAYCAVSGESGYDEDADWFTPGDHIITLISDGGSTSIFKFTMP